MNDIGARLRSERQRLSLSQEAFAELVGINKRSQIKYEKGERFPDVRYLLSAREIGVDLNFIFNGVSSNKSLVDSSRLKNMELLSLKIESLSEKERKLLSLILDMEVLNGCF